ncbi:MAG TPA: hypothetical protein VD738_04480 [Nitrospira sp.]|nr:hypothetical protein [Nitrospira sp.]
MLSANNRDLHGSRPGLAHNRLERIRPAVGIVVALALITGTASAANSSDVQARIDADLAADNPIVVHVVVALCDNVNQGIVPVPEALGNGQAPGSNLYWGALYGVRTYLPRSASWTGLHVERPDDQQVLDRIVLYGEIDRKQRGVSVYIVADAWDGAEIREAMQAYLEMTAGRLVESVTVKQGQETIAIKAGGASHLVAYVGHNGLMDFALDAPAPAEKESPARSAVVLACASKSYFIDHLRSAGAHPLLLTTGLMAPEAYTLDAIIRSWITVGTTAAVTAGAASAYDRYQKCGLPAARRLFWGQP